MINRAIQILITLFRLPPHVTNQEDPWLPDKSKIRDLHLQPLKINWLPKLIDNYHFQAILCSCVFHVLSLVHAPTPRHGSATRPIKGLSQSPRVQVPRRFNNREIFNLYKVKSVEASDAGRPGGDEHHVHQLWRWFQRNHFSTFLIKTYASSGPVIL